MKIKTNATIYLDVPMSRYELDIIKSNCDSREEYQDEIITEVGNKILTMVDSALEKSNIKFEELSIDYVEPYEDGIDELEYEICKYIQ